MITLDELCQTIDTIGVPWANTDFKREESISPPYIALKKSDATTYGANDMTWCTVTEYDIEIYTIVRDYDLERTVMDALDNLGLFFSDGGFWSIPDQGMVEAVLTVTVREN